MVLNVTVGGVVLTLSGRQLLLIRLQGLTSASKLLLNDLGVLIRARLEDDGERVGGCGDSGLERTRLDIRHLRLAGDRVDGSRELKAPKGVCGDDVLDG